MSFPDITNFNSGNWNGWTNSDGTTEGLANEGGNYYWTGKFEIPKSAPYIGTILKKRFTIQDDERDDFYEIQFEYRVRDLLPNEAQLVIFVLARENDNDRIALGFDLDKTTPVNRWLGAGTRAKKWFSGSDSQIRLCAASNSLNAGNSRSVDIDNISIKKVSESIII
jgi:hypothetical protein